jgi:hypothetical protein
MTSADHAGGPCGSRVGRVVAPYREIFAVPGAWRFSAAGVIGRMPMAMIGLATVMFIAGLTGRYGIAGAVSAAGALGYGVLLPAGRTAGRPVRPAPGTATARGVVRDLVRGPRRDCHAARPGMGLVHRQRAGGRDDAVA